jgi:hypothetical protein
MRPALEIVETERPEPVEEERRPAGSVGRAATEAAEADRAWLEAELCYQAALRECGRQVAGFLESLTRIVWLVNRSRQARGLPRPVKVREGGELRDLTIEEDRFELFERGVFAVQVIRQHPFPSPIRDEGERLRRLVIEALPAARELHRSYAAMGERRLLSQEKASLYHRARALAAKALREMRQACRELPRVVGLVLVGLGLWRVIRHQTAPVVIGGIGHPVATAVEVTGLLMAAVGLVLVIVGWRRRPRW